MNKSEQEIYNRVKQCAENYKKQLDILQEKVTNLKGYCTVMATTNISQETKDILNVICNQL